MIFKDKNIEYLFYFCLFTVSLDLSLGYVYDKFYFSKTSIKNDALIYAAAKAKEDILVFGSSRALHHYNPKIIEDSMKLTCFNVGSGGQNIYYHLAMLEASLERYRPKIVILELMTIDFEITAPQWDTEKLGVLLPFYNHSLAAKKAVLRRGESEKFKTISSIYPQNSLLYTSFRNNFFPFNNNINGFMPIEKVWKKGIEKEENTSVKIDTKKLESLFTFIDLCKANKIEIFVFISPYYKITQGKSKYHSIIQQLNNRYQIKIFNFESDTYFLSKPNLFSDPVHLNSLGANEYSTIVSKIVKQNYSED